MNSPRGPAVWDGTGYRSGVLVVETATGRMGITQTQTGDGITVKPLDDEPTWTAPSIRGLRLATNAERRALGLGPRSVD